MDWVDVKESGGLWPPDGDYPDEGKPVLLAMPIGKGWDYATGYWAFEPADNSVGYNGFAGFSDMKDGEEVKGVTRWAYIEQPED